MTKHVNIEGTKSKNRRWNQSFFFFLCNGMLGTNSDLVRSFTLRKLWLKPAELKRPQLFRMTFFTASVAWRVPTSMLLLIHQYFPLSKAAWKTVRILYLPKGSKRLVQLKRFGHKYLLCNVFALRRKNGMRNVLRVSERNGAGAAACVFPVVLRYDWYLGMFDVGLSAECTNYLYIPAMFCCFCLSYHTCFFRDMSKLWMLWPYVIRI